jgi:hypothetical protein
MTQMTHKDEQTPAPTVATTNDLTFWRTYSPKGVNVALYSRIIAVVCDAMERVTYGWASEEFRQVILSCQARNPEALVKLESMVEEAFAGSAWDIMDHDAEDSLQEDIRGSCAWAAACMGYPPGVMLLLGRLGLLPADSDDSSHRFRPKPATYSDRSQPGVPMIPAG